MMNLFEESNKNVSNLFPEKHYEKEYKAKYGDDVDPTLAEQMEEDEGYQQALEKTSRYEGGYVNNPKDPGKETKYGITKKWYPDEDIKNLSKERSEYILYRDYYDGTNIKNLPPEVRDQVFDNAVNQGQGKAIMNLQKSVGAKEDGILGPRTIEKVKESDFSNTLEGFKENVNDRYDEIAKENPEAFEEFSKGWTNRANTY